VLRGIPVAGDSALRCGVLDLFEILRAQLYVRSSGVLLEVTATLGPGDRDDVVAAGEQPGERQLCSGDPFGFRDLFDAVDDLEVRGEVLVVEPRRGPAEVRR
jgi:hypothetical protein